MKKKIKNSQPQTNFTGVESKMGTYWEPTRNPEKHLGNQRGNKGESWGTHRGIIWEIGEKPPT